MNNSTNAIWITIFALISFLIGLLAGALQYARDHDLPGAILNGGSAFVGAMLLLLTVKEYWDSRPPTQP
jgi:hypothetical protein